MSAAATYILLCDAQGNEVSRLYSPTPRQEIKIESIVGRMADQQRTQLSGRRGLPLLLRLFEDSDPGISADALSLLFWYSKERATVLPAVWNLLLTGDGPTVVRRVVMTLERWGVEHEAVVRKLRSTLESKSESLWLRRRAANNLRHVFKYPRFKADAGGTVRALRTVLDQVQDEQLRLAVQRTLEALTP